MSDSFVNPIFGEQVERDAPVDADVTAEVPADVPADGATHVATDVATDTGNVDVDAVIASLESLDETPVAEHVAVFEHAHESLRRALADAGESAVRG